MSGRVSSNWLAVAIILGPVIALVNQALIYAMDSWACERATSAPLHAVAGLCLVLSLATAIWSIRALRERASGRVGDNDDERRRFRFMALTAVGTSVLSSLVVIAQWAAVIVFAPCVRT
jgi:hypothetical protein